MDVDREIAAANARIRRQIDRSADAALARMDARWPSTRTPEPEDHSAFRLGQWLAEIESSLMAGIRMFAQGYYYGRLVVDPNRTVIPRGPQA